LASGNTYFNLTQTAGRDKSSGLFDGPVTLCYIELPRGKFSAAMLFAGSANRFIKKASLDCRRQYDNQRRFEEP
jgi:hypothetical protein